MCSLNVQNRGRLNMKILIILKILIMCQLKSPVLFKGREFMHS